MAHSSTTSDADGLSRRSGGGAPDVVRELCRRHRGRAAHAWRRSVATARRGRSRRPLRVPRGPGLRRRRNVAGARRTCTTCCSDRAAGSRREGVGGTLPVRFPSPRDPGDAGWHIDGSYDVDGAWWVNVRSRGRGLLALFLFTDVGDDDAPTELIVGSHLDVPRAAGAVRRARRVLRRRGETAARLDLRTPPRARDGTRGRRVPLPSVPGPPRDVAASRRRTAHGRAAGRRRSTQPFALRPARDVCPVERAILAAAERVRSRRRRTPAAARAVTP